MERSVVRSVAVGTAVAVMLGLLPGGRARAVAVSEDQRQIVERADYLYDQVWVAQETVAGWRGEHIFEAGGVYRLPYAQPVEAGRYIGYGAAVEEFMAAAGEEDSIFYEERSCYGDGDSTYYGTDCSAFVSWCWGIDRHTTWSIPLVTRVLGMATEEGLRELQLGDALNSRSVGHVVLVTGIDYDAHGEIREVEITEQTPPQLARSRYTPEALAEKYGQRYQICRYEGDVPPVPEGSLLSRCVAYPACGVVEAVADTAIRALPDDAAEMSSTLAGGTRITVTGLYETPDGGLWYGVGAGYLPAEDTVYLRAVTDSITLTDAQVPRDHVEGRAFDVTGLVRGGEHRLVRVAAVVRRGTEGLVITGASDGASGNSYELMNSSVDRGTAFGTVPPGENTFEVYAEYESFRAEDGQVRAVGGVVCLLSVPFSCVAEETTACEHRYTGRITTVPTKDREGVLTYTCACGDSYTSVLPQKKGVP